MIELIKFNTDPNKPWLDVGHEYKIIAMLNRIAEHLNRQEERKPKHDPTKNYPRTLQSVRSTKLSQKDKTKL